MPVNKGLLPLLCCHGQWHLQTNVEHLWRTFHVPGTGRLQAGGTEILWPGCTSQASHHTEIPDERGPQSKHPRPILGLPATEAQPCKEPLSYSQSRSGTLASLSVLPRITCSFYFPFAANFRSLFWFCLSTIKAGLHRNLSTVSDQQDLQRSSCTNGLCRALGHSGTVTRSPSRNTSRWSSRLVGRGVCAVPRAPIRNGRPFRECPIYAVRGREDGQVLKEKSVGSPVGE